jgi:hypothetical protein
MYTPGIRLAGLQQGIPPRTVIAGMGTARSLSCGSRINGRTSGRSRPIKALVIRAVTCQHRAVRFENVLASRMHSGRRRSQDAIGAPRPPRSPGSVHESSFVDSTSASIDGCGGGRDRPSLTFHCRWHNARCWDHSLERRLGGIAWSCGDPARRWSAEGCDSGSCWGRGTVRVHSIGSHGICPRVTPRPPAAT